MKKAPTKSNLHGTNRAKVTFKKVCHIEGCNRRFKPRSRWDLYCECCRKYNPDYRSDNDTEELRIHL